MATSNTPTLQYFGTPIPPSRWFLGGLCLALLYTAIQWFSFYRIIDAGPDLYWDTDPYVRMYRVGSILEGQDWIIRFQNVDGYPDGHAAHWTVPFDGWCVALAKIATRAFAGLIASPLLGLLTLLGFAFWCFVRLPRPIAWAVSLIYLFQPAFHWSTALGRPDHQSLVHACFVLAVIMDLGFWLKAFDTPADKLNRWRVALNSLALGLGIWTTIEMTPLWLVQIASTLATALVMRGQGGWRALSKRALGWFGTLAVVVVAYGIECRFDPTQIRIGNFGNDHLRRWFAVVHEFQPLLMTRGEWRFSGLHELFGLSFYLVPFLAWFFVRSRAVNNAFKLSLGFALLAYGLMVFAQIHWVGHMAVLWPIFAAIAVQSYFEKHPPLYASRSTLYALALCFLFFPCLLGFATFAQRDEFGIHLRPVCDWLRENTPPNEDLERFSMITPQSRGYAVMTQWWQGSYVLYWARRPVVATPYHTNIDAIVDAYRFFVASNWFEAEEILQRRRCRYILVEDNRMFVDDAQRVLRDDREWIEFGRRKAPDGKMRKTFKFLPLFYETMFYKLAVLNGGGLPFRLVYESEERSPYDPNLPRFRVYEYLGNQTFK